MTRISPRYLVLVVLVVVIGVIAVPAIAAPVMSIDITVSEHLSPGPGTVIASDLGDCPVGTSVDTDDATVTTTGIRTTFTGTKTFHCDGGDLIVEFTASINGCPSTDSGHWKVVGGTGVFAGAKGHGSLVGTYTGGTGVSCDSTGIDDHYTGKLKL